MPRPWVAPVTTLVTEEDGLGSGGAGNGTLPRAWPMAPAALVTVLATLLKVLGTWAAMAGNCDATWVGPAGPPGPGGDDAVGAGSDGVPLGVVVPVGVTPLAGAAVVSGVTGGTPAAEVEGPMVGAV